MTGGAQGSLGSRSGSQGSGGTRVIVVLTVWELVPVGKAVSSAWGPEALPGKLVRMGGGCSLSSCWHEHTPVLRGTPWGPEGWTGPTTERMDMRSCHGPQGPTFSPSRSIFWSLCPLQTVAGPAVVSRSPCPPPWSVGWEQSGPGAETVLSWLSRRSLEGTQLDRAGQGQQGVGAAAPGAQTHDKLTSAPAEA